MNQNSHSRIISCTTDGFITDTPFETTVPTTGIFSEQYYNTRKKLTGKGELLERKHHESKGVISWRTRGQLGLSGGIKALTGYQRFESIEETIEKVNKSFNGNKTLPYIQTSLRSAKDIYLFGGHSTIKLTERNFNLSFDNRREITKNHGSYHETKPFLHAQNSILYRKIAGLGSGRYRLYSPISSTQCKGDAYLALTKRMIVRLLRENPSYLKSQSLSRLEIQKITKEIGLPCTLNFISKQKEKPFIFNSIPSTEKTKAILKNLSVVFPSLDISILLRQ